MKKRSMFAHGLAFNRPPTNCNLPNHPTLPLQLCVVTVPAPHIPHTIKAQGTGPSGAPHLGYPPALGEGGDPSPLWGQVSPTPPLEPPPSRKRLLAFAGCRACCSLDASQSGLGAQWRHPPPHTGTPSHWQGTFLVGQFVPAWTLVLRTPLPPPAPGHSSAPHRFLAMPTEAKMDAVPCKPTLLGAHGQPCGEVPCAALGVAEPGIAALGELHPVRYFVA